ncbi:MAG: S1/P1 nuclease, partial [Schlesneria sp.]
MQRIQSLIFLCFLTFSCSPIWGWNDVGHMAVARIAYEKLTDSERAAILAILRHHPHLHELLLKDRPSQASIDEWLFLRAATWPDNVRPPRDHHREPVSSHPVYRFHHATWHYVNFEYRAGQRETSLPSQPLPHRPAPSKPADQTNIIEQLDHSYLIVR